MHNKKIVLGVGLFLALTTTPSFAANIDSTEVDSISPVWSKLGPAWDTVSDKLIDFVGEKKQKLLADLAYASVAGEICEGLKLDRNKFKNEFDTFNDANFKRLSPINQEQYGPKLMTFYGVYVGLMTAEGLLEKPGFCANALDMQSNGEGRFWTVTGVK